MTRSLPCDETTAIKSLLVVLAYVGFISLGLPDGLLGIAVPSMRGFFICRWMLWAHCC